MAGSDSPTDPIGTFMPWCIGLEKRLRQRLLTAREFASLKVAKTSSNTARALYWMIIESVSCTLYVSLKPEELQELVNYCLRLAMCANFAEGWEAGA